MPPREHWSRPKQPTTGRLSPRIELTSDGTVYTGLVLRVVSNPNLDATRIRWNGPALHVPEARRWGPEIRSNPNIDGKVHNDRGVLVIEPAVAEQLYRFEIEQRADGMLDKAWVALGPHRLCGRHDGSLGFGADFGSQIKKHDGHVASSTYPRRKACPS